MSICDFSISAIPALSDNYIWVMINPHHQTALIVDPGDAQPVIAYLEHHHLALKGILITHHHWDHVNGVERLIDYCPVPVYGSKQSELPTLTQHVEEGDSVFIHEHFPRFQIFNIPGHTLDHIAYYTNKRLFCGDTLFAGGCGRLFEGSAEQLYSSLQKMAALPDTTKVYCAHEYTLNNLRFAQRVEPSNHAITNRIQQVQMLRGEGLPSIPSLLIEEKQTNPFLRCHIPEISQQVAQFMQQSLPNAIAVFTALRLWKNDFR